MISNINPSLWGNHFWATMFYVGISYPDNPSSENAQNVKDFYVSMKHVLPCEKCRVHFASNLDKYPLTDHVLSSKNNLLDWLVTLQNEVNSRTNKKPVTINEILDKYTNPKRTITINNKLATTVLLVALIIVLMYYVKYKKT
jgi:hypothetical protein